MMKPGRSSARAAASPKTVPATGANPEERPTTMFAIFAQKPKPFVGPASKRPKASPPVSAPVAKKPKTVKEDVYEVECLLGHKPSLDPKKGKFLYLVHWDGWSDEHNSWEPESNLRGCPEKLKAYHDRILEMTASTDVDKVEESGVKAKLAELRKTVSAIPENLLKKALQDRGYKDVEFSNNAKGLIERGLLMLNGAESLFSKAEGVLLQERYKELKKKQKQALMDFAKEINEKSPEDAEVTVENDVDDEFPPKDFVYSPHCIGGAGVVIPDDPLVGCECTDCSSKNKAVQCCPKMNGSYGEYAHPYNKYKRVIITPGNPIFECNKHCKCPPTCINRVVQHGRKVKVTIFRTEDRGWGLRAAEFIKEGTYVCEYVGEIIPNEEAERRGKYYDAEGRTYLFDLDFASPTDAVNVIDAAKVGNVSHFINHSCEPNLGTYCVYINCVDVNMPQIAFFALRDIKKGEELTFDYSPIPRTVVEDSDDEERELERAMAASLRDAGPNVSGQLSKSKTNGDEIKSEETEDKENKEVYAKAKPKEGPAGVPTVAKLKTGNEGGEDSDGEDAPGDGGDVQSQSAMMCKCGAPTCRKIIFLWGK